MPYAINANVNVFGAASKGPLHVGEFIISGHRILHENSDFSAFLHGGDSSDLSRFADMEWQTFGIGLPFVGHFNPDFRTLMQYFL